MFTPELDRRWLLDRWSRCCAGETLGGRADTSRLAMGFIGPNLIVDLVNILQDITHGGEGTYAPGVSWTALNEALKSQEGAHLPLAAALVSPNACRVLGAALPVGDPYQCIHHWLLREALAQFLSGSRAHTPAFSQAQRDFGAMPHLAGLPEDCQTRNPACLKAFETWWNDACTRLVAYLRDWPTWRSQPLGAFSRRLAAHLGASTALGEWVHARQRQWDRGLAERGFRHAFPASIDWFEEMGNRLLAASEAHYPMEWSPEDVRQWVRLWSWLQALGDYPPLEGIRLPQRDVEVAVHVAPADLPVVLQFWSDIIQRCDQLENARSYAADVFAYPDLNSAESARWAERMSLYWS